MNDQLNPVSKDKLEESASALRNVRVPDGPSPALVASTVEALQSLTTSPGLFRRIKRRELMFRIARYSSVAAALSLLLVGGWVVFGEYGTNIAFAQVEQQLREAKSFSYKVVNEPQGNTQSPGWEENVTKVYFKDPALLREERADGSVLITDGTRGTTLTYDPVTKKARRFRASQPQAHQPQWMAQRRFFLEVNQNWAEAAKRLGEREVDGRKAQGFRLPAGDRKTWTVWVESKTGEPIRVERLSPNFKTTLSHIVLNPDLADSLFSLEPPAGYDLETPDTN
jgi:outer membrane lipoprotein-sorting protein